MLESLEKGVGRDNRCVFSAIIIDVNKICKVAQRKNRWQVCSLQIYLARKSRACVSGVWHLDRGVKVATGAIASRGSAHTALQSIFNSGKS